MRIKLQTLHARDCGAHHERHPPTQSMYYLKPINLKAFMILSEQTGNNFFFLHFDHLFDVGGIKKSFNTRII